MQAESRLDGSSHTYATDQPNHKSVSRARPRCESPVVRAFGFGMVAGRVRDSDWRCRLSRTPPTDKCPCCHPKTVAGETPHGATGVDHAACPPKHELSRDVVNTTLGVSLSDTGVPLVKLGPGGDFTSTIPAEPATAAERQQAILDHERARKAREAAKPAPTDKERAEKIRFLCAGVLNSAETLRATFGVLLRECKSAKALDEMRDSLPGAKDDALVILMDRISGAAASHVMVGVRHTCPECGGAVEKIRGESLGHPDDPNPRYAADELVCGSCEWKERVEP